MSSWTPPDRHTRRGRVLDIVARSAYVGVNELSRELEVSRGTIQTDLRDLEAAGRLRRVWGGAKPAEGGEDRSAASPAVDQVFLMAAALVRASDTVLLACGEASAGIAAALVERADVTDLTVITGDLSACEQFVNHLQRFTVCLTGGVLQHGSLVLARDAVPERPRSAVDIAFLPCHRIDSRGRVHLTDGQLAATATLASIDPRRVVLVSTGDAFDAKGGEPWLTLGDCDALITGSARNRSALDRSRAGGAQILVAT